MRVPGLMAGRCAGSADGPLQGVLEVVQADGHVTAAPGLIADTEQHLVAADLDVEQLPGPVGRGPALDGGPAGPAGRGPGQPAAPPGQDAGPPPPGRGAAAGG